MSDLTHYSFEGLGRHLDGHQDLAASCNDPNIHAQAIEDVTAVIVERFKGDANMIATFMDFHYESFRKNPSVKHYLELLVFLATHQAVQKELAIG